MQVSKITEKDVQLAFQVAQILTFSAKFIDAMRLANIPIVGPGLDGKDSAMVWMADLVRSMAAEAKKMKEDTAPVATKVVTKKKPIRKAK